jgi:hypothetical protein
MVVPIVENAIVKSSFERFPNRWLAQLCWAALAWADSTVRLGGSIIVSTASILSTGQIRRAFAPVVLGI